MKLKNGAFGMPRFNRQQVRAGDGWSRPQLAL
jgi:hypothetical protein